MNPGGSTAQRKRREHEDVHSVFDIGERVHRAAPACSIRHADQRCPSKSYFARGSMRNCDFASNWR